MIGRLFPRQADNNYRGWWLGIWLFVPALLLRAIEGINSILRTRDVAITADGIPVDSYAKPAADTVITLFALNGVTYVMLALLGTVALIRYRVLVPFIYLLMLLEVAAAKAIVAAHPIVRAGATKVGAFSAGALVNDAILGLLVLGFVVSLIPRRTAQ
jgi:hypothetical protein